MPRNRGKRRGLAMMVAIFTMVVVSGIVIAILDTTMLEYAANRNTLAWDKARYMAEAGAQHACAMLEADSTWRTGIATTEFPTGSGCTYSATAVDGANSTIIVTATGTAGGVTRYLTLTIQEQ
jgi:type II secretory pathway component PulK